MKRVDIDTGSPYLDAVVLEDGEIRNAGIPIIDIFYNGTGNPSEVLIPNLHYLKG